MFTALGKEVTVLCPDTPPETLKFLPGFEKFQGAPIPTRDFVITINLSQGMSVEELKYTVEDNKVNIIVVPQGGGIDRQQISFGDTDKPYDLIVVVDTADTKLLGAVYEQHASLFERVPVLNVDHHVSNTRFGQMQLIDSTAASATEVLYGWFLGNPTWAQHITPDMATLLLTGLITDTRSFQNPNTTPRSLEVAAELLERGARQQEIIQHVYKTKPLSTLKIWGRALNRIQVDRSAGIVWSAVSIEDLQEMGATSNETHGILDELISTIPDADVYVLFTQTEDATVIKASMRSSERIDSSRLAATCFGGGGHPRASGFRVNGAGNFQLTVLESVKKLIEGMAVQRAGDGQVPPSTEQKATDVVRTLSRSPETSGTTDVVQKLQ
jgi:nanoRNase/pAp phosphatase (c-di-AMP/oligoRNAs hydrolase)